MCGIVGMAYDHPILDKELLVALRDTMVHRGPDDAGAWWSEDGRVGLGHRRLAIIDLSPGGRQPMTDKSGRICITYNGEIYNFQELRRDLEQRDHCFHTSSDTEVVIAAYRQWGTECLQRFNGMFAFAIYDTERKRLFLARDRAGEKPLFYYHQRGTFAFASELKALIAGRLFTPKIDLEALSFYLAFGYVPGEFCILQGVKKLPAAHWLSFDLNSGSLEKRRYWRLPEPPLDVLKPTTNSWDELTDELESLLADAVKRQMAADVPVGILLSGGLDSSLVTAMAVNSVSKVKTFTIRFPGYGKFDETEHARLIARHFCTEHIELEADPAVVESLPALARQFDEPIADSGVAPTFLVTKAVSEHCTVALGGDGGDELFGGYDYYSRMLLLKERFGFVPAALRAFVSELSAILLPLGFKGRSFLQSFGVDLDGGAPQTIAYFDRRSRKSLLPGCPSEYSMSPEKSLARRNPQGQDLLQRATRNDFEYYLAEDLLPKVDRSSMLNSVEVRAPWLDYRLIEFAFGKVPSQLKADRRRKKILPKHLALRLLPKEFDHRRKQGLSIPLSSWIRGREWGDYIKQILLDSEEDVWDKNFISKMIKGQEFGCANSERLFALTMFELWRKEYGIPF